MESNSELNNSDTIKLVASANEVIAELFNWKFSGNSLQGVARSVEINNFNKFYPGSFFLYPSDKFRVY